MVSVLIAVDGSEHADKAFAWYLNILHKPGNKVLLCHISEPVASHFGFRARLAVSETEWMAMVAERIKTEDELMAKYTKPLKDNQVEHEVVREEGGEAGHKLCHVAEQKNVDYMVTGTRGLGKIRRTVLGSVSDYILHHAHCPVVISRH